MHETWEVNACASALECKTCGYKFIGGATRIKQYFTSLVIDVDTCPNPPPLVLLFYESHVKKIKMLQSASMIRPFRIDDMNEVNDET